MPVSSSCSVGLKLLPYYSAHGLEVSSPAQAILVCWSNRSGMRFGRSTQYFVDRSSDRIAPLLALRALVFLFSYAFKRFSVLFLLHELATFFATGRFVAPRPLFASRILHLSALLHRTLARIFTCILCHNITSPSKESSEYPFLRVLTRL